MGFMDKNFLLKTKTAQHLYHDYAAHMPIIDYHCHINPVEILENKWYKNISQIWLYGDHYKWRAMRSNGVDENFCTGKVSDREKFDAFVKTMPYAAGNPLYHWSHLELRRYFHVNDIICKKNADAIWEKITSMLGEKRPTLS